MQHVLPAGKVALRLRAPQLPSPAIPAFAQKRPSASILLFPGGKRAMPLHLRSAPDKPQPFAHRWQNTTATANSQQRNWPARQQINNLGTDTAARHGARSRLSDAQSDWRYRAENAAMSTSFSMAVRSILDPRNHSKYNATCESRLRHWPAAVPRRQRSRALPGRRETRGNFSHMHGFKQCLIVRRPQQRAAFLLLVLHDDRATHLPLSAYGNGRQGHMR